MIRDVLSQGGVLNVVTSHFNDFNDINDINDISILGYCGKPITTLGYMFTFVYLDSTLVWSSQSVALCALTVNSKVCY
jgi:hypothetical protein